MTVNVAQGSYMLISIAHPNLAAITKYRAVGDHYWTMKRDLEEAAKESAAWVALYWNNLRSRLR